MDEQKNKVEIFLSKMKNVIQENIKELYVNSNFHNEIINDKNIMDVLRRVILKGNGKLLGFNERVVYPNNLPFPQIYRPNIKYTHLKFFHEKLSRGESVKWFFVGDSILSVGLILSHHQKVLFIRGQMKF